MHMKESVCNLIILLNILMIVMITVASWPTSFLVMKIIEVVLITDGTLYLLFKLIEKLLTSN